MIFTKGKAKIDIEPLQDESESVFNSRAELILKIKIKNGDKYNDIELEKFSKIWANIKYRGCRYNSSIYNLIRSFTNDLSMNIVDYNPPKSSNSSNN
ncbi:hypothetical protein CPAV1605_774 [seawater metagenome]|uniref:XRN2-binding (XTBD) domain-containing protein n=1 Tax=seawater metagenome TaxID=1561972 RepID=A0A5E8CK67_9ZZZZ